MNPYFTNTIDLLPVTRARSSDVESNLSAVEVGFDGVKVDMDLKAPLLAPTLTIPRVTATPLPGDNSTLLASTAFVQQAISSAAAINLPSVGADGYVLTVVGGVPTWFPKSPDFLLFDKGIV
jgi:hypothetical protein